MQRLLHLVGILFPHINDDARSKSHQIYLYGLQVCQKAVRKTEAVAIWGDCLVARRSHTQDIFT